MGAGVRSRSPLLPCPPTPWHPRCSGPNLRVDFIEFVRNRLEDAIQRRAYNSDGKRRYDNPFQGGITGVFS